MSTIDIFIKTYYKDYPWLEYLLKSIKKFASGFRDVIIVSEPEYPIPDSILTILPVKVFYEPFPKKSPTNPIHGIGYLWQQYIKLNWIKYSDADAVLVMDSDEIFTFRTTPEDFKMLGKFPWFYRSWDGIGDAICWKDPTEKLLKIEPKYEAMCITGFILQRETTIAFKNFICETHKVKDFWDLIVNKNLSTFSEFNAFGSFIYHYDRREYSQILIQSLDINKLHNITIRKSWSWGGLTEEEKIKRDAILN